MSEIIKIGCDPECQISIQNQGLANVHAIMYISDGMLCMELLDGNTAQLNGFEVEGKYWLQQNDELLIGNVKLDLNEIYAVLCDSYDGDKEGFYQEGSDAVTIKKNWLGIALVTLFVLAVTVFLWIRFVNYKHKLEEKKVLKIQYDSIIDANQTKLDSINQLMEQYH